MTPATLSAVALQATQADVFEQIHADVLLSSSLWANIALAGLSILLFVYMGRNVEGSRAKFIWAATLMIPLVSISSYTGLVSGLTVGLVEMPAGHALAGEEVLSQWGRYLTWALSTPMILLALVQSVGLTSWGYSLLDIGAEYGFAFLLLRWVAANQDVVACAGRTATTGSGATPADDD